MTTKLPGGEPMSTLDRWLASLRMITVQDMRIQRDLR
jgi:hypothetical protein